MPLCWAVHAGLAQEERTQSLHHVTSYLRDATPGLVASAAFPDIAGGAGQLLAASQVRCSLRGRPSVARQQPRRKTPRFDDTVAVRCRPNHEKARACCPLCSRVVEVPLLVRERSLTWWRLCRCMI